MPVIVLGFAGIIMLGSILLTLPCASSTGRAIPWFDNLFTATSAVCVTGLIVQDTGTAYSTFGHLVILLLIETGGLGFMTFATLVFRLMGRSLSMRDRMIVQESINEGELGGAVAHVIWMIRSAFVVQFIGAVVLSLRLIPQYGRFRGAFFSVFHAVSAFCNAGFDLFGHGLSLTAYAEDRLITFAAIALIVTGGLGFAPLYDIIHLRRRRKMQLHTKLVLVTYSSLLIAGFILILALEWNNPGTLGPRSFGDKIAAALFQSVTLRTAGFNTIDQASLRDATKLISGLLMLVGCAPASTGGGIKVTTFAIMVLTVRMVVRGDNCIVAFKRRIDRELIQRTVAIVCIATCVAFFDVFALSLMQPDIPLIDLYYECFSAIGTVGISAAGTANLLPMARILIMMTMFIGRVGPLSLALLFMKRQSRARESIRYPEDKVMIG
ncbi:MAG: Trk family potassium uptake protein [Clostridia bacterium]|nr:Trk family potassium uptake protein [Clostridia bacterium]